MPTIKLTDGNTPLTFVIKKMPATQAEAWMIKAATLIGRGSDFSTTDSSDIVKALCSIPYKEGKELLDELLGCCYRVDGKVETQVDLSDCDGYISSPLTLLRLRIEAAKANFGFFTELRDYISLATQSSKPIAES